ncbi:MAG: hypothetical protein ACLP8A_13330 [Methylovirgula sp.]
MKMLQGIAFLGAAGVVAAVLWGAVVLGAKDAQATPAFAKQTGKACSYCHKAMPSLNDEGKRFKANGHKL